MEGRNPEDAYRILSSQDFFAFPSTSTSLAEELHVTIGEMWSMMGEEAENDGGPCSRERVFACIQHGVVLLQRMCEPWFAVIVVDCASTCEWLKTRSDMMIMSKALSSTSESSDWGSSSGWTGCPHMYPCRQVDQPSCWSEARVCSHEPAHALYAALLRPRSC